ncbi:MAG: hypothetical protein IIA02_10055, partial [Proteobacteria bacterium]|nr:hypothetical protein [Pseudomonadota bacterium]
GATGYSNIATIVTHTRSFDTGFSREMKLPRFDPEDIRRAFDEDNPEFFAARLNDTVKIVEDKFNTQVVADVPCDVCVVDGAIVLDASRCTKFVVDVTEPINSVSIIRQPPGHTIEVTFIPDGPGHTVSGWPRIIQSGGGDDDVENGCGNPDNPLVLIPTFLTQVTVDRINETVAICATLDKEKDKGGGSDSDTGLALTIECEQTLGEGDFRSTALEGTTCAVMNCSDTSPSVIYRARGGSPGYSYSITVPVANQNGPVLSIMVKDRTVTVSPPTNDGGVSGAAYQYRGRERNLQAAGPPPPACGCGPSLAYCVEIYNCDDSLQSRNTFSGAEPPLPQVCTANTANQEATCQEVCKSIRCNPGVCQAPHTLKANSEAEVIDLRTTQMRLDGCVPCAVGINNAVLTVTDRTGAQVSITVAAAG